MQELFRQGRNLNLKMICKSRQPTAWATILFVGLTMPFATAAHLAAEAASLGLPSGHVILSAQHAYLIALNLAGLLVFAAAFAGVSPAERRRRVAVLVAALPGGGHGPRFFTAALFWQIVFFATTQAVEGDPIAAGHLVLGILAALASSVAGAALIARCNLRILRAFVALHQLLDPTRGRGVLRVDGRHSRAVRVRRLCFSPSIANRPPPLSAT